jgi:hypothetical protein
MNLTQYSRWGQVCSWSHQVPGFAKLFEAPTTSLASRRIERQNCRRRHTIDWNDVPNIFHRNIGHQKINFFRSVGHFIAVRSPQSINPLDQAENRFHLHPPKALAVIHDEVIALAVSMRPGHAKTQTRRLVQKRELGQLSFLFSLKRPADQRRAPCRTPRRITRFFLHMTPIKKAPAGSPAAPVCFEIYSLLQE